MKRIQNVVLLICIFVNINVFSQSQTFAPGSYIVNMGVSGQTVGNGLKPYGLIYELLRSYQVPVKWVIKSGKAKDSKDFTYASVDYKGGTFIIPKEFISSAIAARITVWEGRGVVGVYTTSPLTVNVSRTLNGVPKWTLNNANISISQSFFTTAGIPATAYNQTDPANLNACNDIFVMPHASPTWAVHGNLYNWNRINKGAIWSGCHAVSLLENLVNPGDTLQKMHFLSTGGLMDFNSHADGTPAYNYFFNRADYNGSPITARADDPVFQMMGIEDAAHNNGSEQVYIPKAQSSWRNTTHIGCYDSVQNNVTANSSNGPAALTLYGRGFGLNSAGLVMYQSGHDIEGSGAANVSALRQFFNFSFEAMQDKAPVINSVDVPLNIHEDYPYTVSISASSPTGSSLSYQWTANCAGTFANPNAASTIFTPSIIDSTATYSISCIVSDACSRYTFQTTAVTGFIALPLTLLKFDARDIRSDVQLDWSTSNEIQVDRFEIYRSLNGRDFVKVGSVKALGFGNEVKNYTYLDQQLSALRIVYYRLKIIDQDQAHTWSNIAQVKITTTGFKGIVAEVYPNPANSFINIAIKDMPGSDYTISVTDAYGRTVKQLVNSGSVNENNIRLDIEELEMGIYFISIVSADGMICTSRFIKE